MPTFMLPRHIAAPHRGWDARSLPIFPSVASRSYFAPLQLLTNTTLSTLRLLTHGTLRHGHQNQLLAHCVPRSLISNHFSAPHRAMAAKNLLLARGRNSKIGTASHLYLLLRNGNKGATYLHFIMRNGDKGANHLPRSTQKAY